MKQNKLTFESENLVVDWISFKFQSLENKSLENNEQRKIVHYLSKLGFDSSQESGKLAKPIKEAIQLNLSNKFEVLFVKDRAPHFTFLDSTLLGFTFFRKNKELTGQSFLQEFLIELISITLELIKQMTKPRSENFSKIVINN